MAKYEIGAMVNETMPPNKNGTLLVWPGVVVTGESVDEKTIVDANTGLPVVIKIVTVDVLSYRTNLAGEQYTALTTETVSYGFKIGLTPRFRRIADFEVEADGTLLTLEQMLERHEASRAAFAQAQAEARVEATDAAAL